MSMVLIGTVSAVLSCSDNNDNETIIPNNQPATLNVQNTNDTIYFNEGENKFLPLYQMNVTFKTLLHDNRCSAGVPCTINNVAVTQVEVIGTSTRPRLLTLATGNTPIFKKSEVFDGYTITLVKLTPEPSASGASLAGQYKIGITIKK